MAGAKNTDTFGRHAQVAPLLIFRPVSREQRLKTLLKPARVAPAKPTRV